MLFWVCRSAYFSSFLRRFRSELADEFCPAGFVCLVACVLQVDVLFKVLKKKTLGSHVTQIFCSKIILRTSTMFFCLHYFSNKQSGALLHFLVSLYNNSPENQPTRSFYIFSAMTWPLCFSRRRIFLGSSYNRCYGCGTSSAGGHWGQDKASVLV